MTADSVANFLTLTVAAVTAWMAWETRRMGKATQQMAALSAAPELALQSFDMQPVHQLDTSTGAVTDCIQPRVIFTLEMVAAGTYDVSKLTAVLDAIYAECCLISEEALRSMPWATNEW